MSASSPSRHRSTHRRRTLALTVAVGTVLAVAPAAASTVTVSLSAGAGSRMLRVTDLAGAPLTALDFGRGGSLPFAVSVTDTALVAPAADFSVQSTMSNLYRAAGGGGYDYATSVPSSQVSVGSGASALGAVGNLLRYSPPITLDGALGSCLALSGADAALAGILTNPDATALCSLLGLGGLTLPVSTGLVGSAVEVALADGLGGLPLALSPGGGGAFTVADFGSGIGSGDAAGAAATVAAATAITLLSGTVAPLTPSLVSAVGAAVAGLPLASETGTGALASTAAVTAALVGSSNATVSSLGAAIAALGSSALQLAVLTKLTATVGAFTPSDLLSVTGTYRAYPVLRVAAAGAAPGDYAGTLTVTLVQP